ncbi:1298_t:CDS:2 [Gigaspora margarita]|uniref:1298_t:CDS:1 n=1 Tax=Gigaspora margarita TaxID=4874 RepID=A0ABM8VYF7_GIGMA|nr:1298_t:CDS:2 [Gigaspora margarita]
MIETIPTTNISTIQTAPTQNPSTVNGVNPQDTLQTLLALLNNKSDSSQNQPSYLGIPENDETLFLLTDWHEHRKPIANTLILRKKNRLVLDSFSGLVETKKVEDPDKEMAKGQTEQEKDPEVQNKLESSRKNDSKVKAEIGELLEGRKNGKRLENRISYINGKLLRDNDKVIKKGQYKPVTYLSSRLEKYQSISDLFDYYYEHEVQIGIEYKTGTLDETQQS